VGLLLAVSVAPVVAADCGAPAAMGDGWAVGAPASEGLDPALICGLDARLKGWQEADPHGVVVARNGVLVYEDYFAGPDQRWPEQHWRQPFVETPHNARTKHDLSSITKSVVAILVGIARDRGLIRSLDVPVLSFFPKYADLRSPERERITLADLLTMRSGLRWPYKPYLDTARKMEAAADPYRFVLGQPVVAPPGTRFHYNNGSVEVIGAILHKVTGAPLDQFAKAALFDRLGIADWEWGRMANGNIGAAGDLRLRPRDLAKIGQLVLDNGVWRGRRIVSSDWIKEMTTARVFEKQESVYGYLWWFGHKRVGGRAVDWMGSTGWGGQLLAVVPSLSLVVVVTAGLYNFDGDGDQDLAADAVMDTFVIPAASPH
jgi:CubicO group peptidase (beta-lactamase class C family)